MHYARALPPLTAAVAEAVRSIILEAGRVGLIGRRPDFMIIALEGILPARLKLERTRTMAFALGVAGLGAGGAAFYLAHLEATYCSRGRGSVSASPGVAECPPAL